MLRWREPMPPQTWKGLREAREFGPPCAQPDRGWNHDLAKISSEDCLTLNIWAPDVASARPKAVMVFLHGGSNQGGGSRGGDSLDPVFDGRFLASHGVLVVTVNYRLGVFGFFTHPELTTESAHHASGNLGILDQIAALEWIQKNIAGFSGDPAQVTLFGQSAGAADIQCMMSSKLARGLFARAIAESANVVDSQFFPYPFLSESERKGLAFAKRLGAPDTGSIAFLRKLSTAELLGAYATPGASPTFSLIIDGYVVPGTPAQAFVGGEEMAVPLIIGSNGREGDSAHMGVGKNTALDLSAKPAVQTNRIPDTAAKSIVEFYGPLGERALEVYRLDATAYPPHGDITTQFKTDITMRCGAWIVAKWHSHRAPTWRYEFTHGYEPLGAVHIWELPYVFGMLISPADGPADRKLSDQIQQYWVNFAKTGDPNSDMLPPWPRVDSDESYLDFTSDGPLARENLRLAACELYLMRVENILSEAR
jgi:para-nitrobenzyl esterase